MAQRCRPWATCSRAVRPYLPVRACSWKRPGGCTRTSAALLLKCSTRGSLVPVPGWRANGWYPPGPVAGTGLRFLPVFHHGNHNSSEEEADQVASLVRSLVDEKSSWVDQQGLENPVTLEDILIIAPYNAQVFKIQERLPRARVGTVDKFQGQEAPVVIYSMATSTPVDAPHGMEFLYGLNRLNVATSRARCVCVLVGSPELFAPECQTPRQMQLANAFCRYRELAAEISC